MTWKASALLLALLAGSLAASLVRMNPVYLLLAVVVVAALALALNPWKGVILMLLATQVNFYSFDVGAFTFRPEQLIFLLAASAWIILVFAQGKAVIYSTILDKAIWLLLAAGILSSFLNSSVPRAGYQGVALQLVYVSIFFFTVNVLLNNRSKIDSVVKLMMAVSVVHALYALIALGFFISGIFIGGISDAHIIASGFTATTGLMSEPNLFGAFTGMMTLVFAAHLVTPGKNKIMKSRYLVIGFVLLFTACAASMTRGAWIGVVIAVPALIFCAKPKWNVINPKAIMLFLMIVSLFIVVLPIVNNATSSQGNSDVLYTRIGDIVNVSSGTGEGRLIVEGLALDEWKDNPIIGDGVLSFRQLGRHGWLFGAFIQNLHDTGLVGLGLTMWIFLVPIIYGLWASTKAKSNIRKASLIGFSLGAVTMFTASQVSSFFWLGFPWFYLGVLIAMAKTTLDEDKAANAAVADGRAV